MHLYLQVGKYKDAILAAIMDFADSSSTASYINNLLEWANRKIKDKQVSTKISETLTSEALLQRGRQQQIANNNINNASGGIALNSFSSMFAEASSSTNRCVALRALLCLSISCPSSLNQLC